MLNYIITGSLELYVANADGAKRFLHRGSEKSDEMGCELHFEVVDDRTGTMGYNGYGMTFRRNMADKLIVTSEKHYYSKQSGDDCAITWNETLYANTESILSAPAVDNLTLKVIQNVMKSWHFYQFHDTTKDANGIVPVLLEIKTYTDDTTSSLYVAVNLHEIKRSRIIGYTPGDKCTEPYPLPTSINVSIADLLSNVNVEDKNLLKYVPDGFLNEAQKEAKQDALKETAKYVDKKNRQRLRKADKTADGDSFVGEPIIDYASGEYSIVFILRRKPV